MATAKKKKRAPTNKAKAFVDAYFACGFNATEAAKRAGYSQKTAYSIGHENLKKPEIAALVAERMKKAAMPANEVLARLAAIARGDVSHFLTDKGDIDYTTEQAKANIHLLKKARVKRGVTKSGEPWTETEIELHDPQSALVNIGRHHGLFVDKFAPTDPTGKKEYDAGAGRTDEDRISRVMEILEAARARGNRKDNGGTKAG